MPDVNPFDFASSDAAPARARKTPGIGRSPWVWVAVGSALLLLALCGGGATIGYLALRSKSPADAGRNDGPQKKPLGEPVAKLKAQQLFYEYGENELAADGRYAGKTLCISGELHAAKKDSQGRYCVGFVTMEFPGMSERAYAKLSPRDKKWFNEGYPPNVVCYIDPDAQGAFAKLPAMSERAIIGRCVGRHADSEVGRGYIVVLEDCILGEAR
jgi:hypothetical protein